MLRTGLRTHTRRLRNPARRQLNNSLSELDFIRPSVRLASRVEAFIRVHHVRFFEHRHSVDTIATRAAQRILRFIHGYTGDRTGNGIRGETFARKRG